MNNKVGRNDPCLCGSGQKYKKCCMVEMTKHEPSSLIDLAWVKLRKLEGTVIDNHLIHYMMQTLPSEVIEQASLDCLPEELPEGVDKDIIFNLFFIPWCLFNWIPGDSFGVADFEPNETISGNYLLSHQGALNKREQRFIAAMNLTYYSFYIVQNVEVDNALHVKDILLGSEHTIKEKQGTHYLKRGHIVFGRILTLENQSIFVGMAPLVIPTHYHHSLIDFKNYLIAKENSGHSLTPKLLRELSDVYLPDYFFYLINEAYSKSMPMIENTDGELVQFSTSYFRLETPPEKALEQLLPMTLSNNAEDFLSDATRTTTGEVQQIDCPWLKKGNKKQKGWENTIMGNITIEEGRLTLETNSEERTKKGKKLLAKYLGKSIVFQQTLIESVEQKMSSMSEQEEVRDSDTSSSEFMALPEVREKLKNMAKEHWENWFNEPIPALKNKTPREAAKTTSGREHLEALLMQYESHDSDASVQAFTPDIDYLKKELGLL